MDNGVNVVWESLQNVPVADVAPDLPEPDIIPGSREVGRLDGGVVEVVIEVEAAHVRSSGKEGLRDVRADEARGASQENAHTLLTRSPMALLVLLPAAARTRIVPPRLVCHGNRRLRPLLSPIRGQFPRIRAPSRDA